MITGPGEALAARRAGRAEPSGGARVWETATGTLLSTLAEHQAQLFGVAFHPREALLATGSIDQTVRLRFG